jgi:hypothetical protein
MFYSFCVRVGAAKEEKIKGFFGIFALLQKCMGWVNCEVSESKSDGGKRFKTSDNPGISVSQHRPLCQINVILKEPTIQR